MQLFFTTASWLRRKLEVCSPKPRDSKAHGGEKNERKMENREEILIHRKISKMTKDGQRWPNIGKWNRKQCNNERKMKKKNIEKKNRENENNGRKEKTQKMKHGNM